MKKKTLKAFLLIVCILFNQNIGLSQTNSEPSRYDIIISEIMAKPTPEIGLPAVEYIELHSRLPYPCFLQNWKLLVGNTTKILPDIPLDSCGYVVIVAQKFAETFAPFCDRLVTLSSLAITDGGQALTLLDGNGEVIHHVSFKPSWHSERIKQEGGWSLEIIDEGWPCAGSWNWNSSTDPSGGTPGRTNSIRNTLYDNTIPYISGITMRDSSTLRVHFSKTLMYHADTPAASFQTLPELDILSVQEVPPAFTSLDLRLAGSPETGVLYSLKVTGALTDCGGNTCHTEESTPFGRPHPPSDNDLVINEILTNPWDGLPADYLEIYNRSNRVIDLKDVKVGYGGDTLPQKAVTAVPKGCQLMPGQYATLCRNREVTIAQYVCKDEKRLFTCDSLPDFAISQGIIYLTDISLQHIDRLAYTEEMHYPKLLTTKGVSLERLYADRPTQDENNWRSAAESAGFGTPGYENSQKGSAFPESEFSVEPEVFSPNSDGIEDFAEVICRFTDGEQRVNITLYNNRGHPVKHLANNILCANEARFRWDGEDDNGQPAPAGMYVAQIECWDLQSQKSVRKRKVVSIFR